MCSDAAANGSLMHSSHVWTNHASLRKRTPFFLSSSATRGMGTLVSTKEKRGVPRGNAGMVMVMGQYLQ